MSLFSLNAILFADTVTWTGAVDNDFSNAGNWNGGDPTGSGNTIYINDNASDVQLNKSMTVNYMYMGTGSTDPSSLTLNTGANLTGAEMFIGEDSASKVTVGSGATLKVTDYFYIGRLGGSNGALEVKDGATVDISGTYFYVGQSRTGQPETIGTITQTGGSISINVTNNAFLGDNPPGTGIINISGGTFTVKNSNKDFVLGTRGKGTINLSGSGVLTSEGTVKLAYAFGGYASQSTITQTGGIFNANKGITFGQATANKGTGEYKLSGGTLNTTSITYGSKTPASALFEISGTGVANISGALAVPTNVKGGTLNVGSIAIPASGKLDVSDGTINLGEGGITAAGAYTITLSGGTFATNEASWSTSLNATVADNSTITFAPESGQTITWEGALTGNGDILKTGEGRLKINYDNDNSEVIKFDVDNFVVASGPVDIKGYMYCNLSVEGPDAVFSPGNSVGDAVFGGGFILKEGATLLIEQDASGIDTLTASSFNIDSNSIIDIAADSLQPGASYDIIFQTDSEGNPIIFTEAQATDDYWNNLLTPESAYYWNLSVSGNIVRASVDANAVPEPSTWALLALGVCGLLYLRKRKN